MRFPPFARRIVRTRSGSSEPIYTRRSAYSFEVSSIPWHSEPSKPTVPQSAFLCRRSVRTRRCKPETHTIAECIDSLLRPERRRRDRNEDKKDKERDTKDALRRMFQLSTLCEAAEDEDQGVDERKAPYQPCLSEDLRPGNIHQKYGVPRSCPPKD